MRKIAIVRRNGLGDLLCAFPLVRYFQKNEPKTQITLFLDSGNAPLIPYLPAVDRVVIFPAGGNKYLNLWRIARKHQKEFDLAICAKTSPMKLMNIFLYWLKAKKQIAYVDESWHSRLVNHPLRFDPEEAKGMHQALKGLKIIAPEMKKVPEDLYPTLTLPLGKKLFTFSFPTVLVSATTTRSASRLSESRYSNLLNRLHQEKPIHVLILGKEKDKERADAIASRLKSPHLVHFPQNFEKFMEFLNAADFYFVGDGGIAHIGAALGKKGVVYYGETNPIEWGPLSEEMEVFYHPTHVDNLDDDLLFQALTRVSHQRGEKNRLL